MPARASGERLLRRLAADGFDLALVARREEVLREVADSLGDAGVGIYAGDVADPEAAGSHRSRGPGEAGPDRRAR